MVRKRNETDTLPNPDGKLSSSVERGNRSEVVLTVLRGQNVGAIHAIDGAEAVLGRSPEADFAIPDETLSRRHARIARIGEGFVIEDLGSTNGTFVDGDRVEGFLPLQDGARVYLGTRTVLHFRLHDPVELDVVRSTHALTLRDPLTGLYNRRHLEERLQSELAFAVRHDTPLSLILLDLDHFKQINDRYGHPVGDAALKALADAVSVLIRGEDVLARYGGEEFAVVVRDIDRESTLQLAERIRATVADQELQAAGVPLRLTASLGVAIHVGAGRAEDEALTATQLLDAADRALYASKEAGRNRVSIADRVAGITSVNTVPR